MTDYNNPELYTRIDHDNGDVLFQQVKKKEPQFLQEWDQRKVKFILESDNSVSAAGLSSLGFVNYCTSAGRGFRTHEDAETFRDAEQMRMKMRRAAAESWGDEVIDWHDAAQIKEVVYFCRSKGTAVVSQATIYSNNQPAFKRGTAQAFIDSVGEEELIKAWRW